MDSSGKSHADKKPGKVMMRNLIRTRGVVLTNTSTKPMTFLRSHAKQLTLVIATLALVLSGINFYWTFLKDRRVLHLIYVQEHPLQSGPYFAIANGGKSDILITSVSCSFKYMDNSQTIFVPKQSIEWNRNEESLLPSGKAFHYKVTFKEDFPKSFVEKGPLNSMVLNSQWRMHDLYVDLSWIEMDGRYYRKSIKLVRYGFDDNCRIVCIEPISSRRSIDLYREKAEGLGVFTGSRVSTGRQ
jgi:hypothetical protein